MDPVGAHPQFCLEFVLAIASDSDASTCSVLTATLGVIYSELHDKTHDADMTILILGLRGQSKLPVVRHHDSAKLPV